MPVILVVIVSIVLVTAARLRRRIGASAASLAETNGARWLSALMARRFSWRAIPACMLLLTLLTTVGLKTGPGALPDGQWKAALATRFDRNIYILSVETSAADDAVIIATFNAAPNKSRFNFFYRNCSNQATAIFALILPQIDTIGDRTSGITMETPKGLAKALVDQTHKNPELNLQVRRYAQIPGTSSRSRDVLFPMENTYRSLGFAPWWFFGGFREVALGAILYHEVISPFGMLESSRDFISAKAAQLTLEQRRLRRRQDEVRQALASAHNRGPRWWKLSELNTEVFRRLGEIRNEKRAEVTRVAGSKAQWQELDMEFRTMVRALTERRFIPEVLREPLAQFEPNGSLSDPLLQYFEASGDFSVDAARGPWLTLPLVEGETPSTGLSRSQILAGDPRVALLVLAAIIVQPVRIGGTPRGHRIRAGDVCAVQAGERHHQPSGWRTIVGVGCRGSRFSKRTAERRAEHFPRRDEERGQNRTQDEPHRAKEHESAER